MKIAIMLFFVYAHKDVKLRNSLERHLKPLQREGVISMWHDRDISVGMEWEPEIIKHLNNAQVILLLISPYFMDSDYCYSIEMVQAVDRHERRDAVVIPVILRPVYWQGAPFGKLQALPTEAKAITSWRNQDEAFLNVVLGIRKVVEQLNANNFSGRKGA
jgi:hypothetical protein